MGVRTDAGLALITLTVFVGAFIIAGSTLSITVLAVGGVGTVVFELVASRHSEPLRRVWNQPVVQFGTLLGAGVIAVLGAVVAPAIVLSAGIGALVMYLLVLVIVLVRR